MSKALLVPADPEQPCRVIDFEADLKDIHELGYVERCIYDRDATTWVNDDGWVRGLLANKRASDYVVHRSLAAQQGRMTEDYALAGPVVFTGPEPTQDVPERLLKEFGLEPTQEIGL